MLTSWFLGRLGQLGVADALKVNYKIILRVLRYDRYSHSVLTSPLNLRHDPPQRRNSRNCRRFVQLVLFWA